MAQRMAQLQDAARLLRAEAPGGEISVAVVAGSGLSGIAEHVSERRAVPYAEIPGWPASTVKGHAGSLVLGRIGGVSVGVACGRVHLYEGRSPQDLVFGVRVLASLGARTLIVTNAAGGLDGQMSPGDVMVIRDHISFPSLAGLSPLVGDNDDALGPRFPGMVGAYDARLGAAALGACQKAGLQAHHGVYAMVGGPAYETPAEARLIAALGADAVGMSTAPEVIAARHMGLRVVGLSLITNIVTLGQHAVELDEDLHSEVTARGATAADQLSQVISTLVGASAHAD